MLNWFSGQRAATDNHPDPDTTQSFDPPETPAPVFAVRAFKQAIFGTPQTTHHPAAKPRRHSTADPNNRLRPSEPRPARPRLDRPKSAGDAHALVSRPAPEAEREPMASPTKGILMTPGTAKADRKEKNVTFGVQVVEGEGRRPVGRDGGEGGDKVRGSGKLQEALEAAREESRKGKGRRGKEREKEEKEKEESEEEDHESPKTGEGKYWKREYDVYRTNTQREVKKLITKQKAAKSYAREKDVQCTELAEELRQETKKVESLEKKRAELAGRLKDLEDQLRRSHDAEKKLRADAEASKRQPQGANAARGDDNEAMAGAGFGLREKASKSTTTSGRDAVQRPSEPYQSNPESMPPRSPERKPIRGEGKVEADALQRPSERFASAREARRRQASPRKADNGPVDPPEQTQETAQSKLDSSTNTRARPANVHTKSHDDIWAQTFNSSSTTLGRSSERPPASPRGSRAVTCGTTATPLKTLAVNSVPNGRREGERARPSSAGADSKPQLAPEVKEQQPNARPLVSPDHHGPANSADKSAAPHARSKHSEPGTSQHDDFSLPVPSSSPFQPTPKPSTPQRKPATAPPVPPHAAPANENTPPAATAARAAAAVPPQQPHQKPSAAWNSINGPKHAQAQAGVPGAGGKRTTSLVGRDGKEVGAERLEAARKRLEARGRVVS